VPPSSSAIDRKKISDNEEEKGDRGALALRILAHDERGKGRAITVTMTMGAFEKSPDDNQPPRRGRGRLPRCRARGESAGALREGLRWGGARTTISHGWRSQPPRRGRGSQPQHWGKGGQPGRHIFIRPVIK